MPLESPLGFTTYPSTTLSAKVQVNVGIDFLTKVIIVFGQVGKTGDTVDILQKIPASSDSDYRLIVQQRLYVVGGLHLPVASPPQGTGNPWAAVRSSAISMAVPGFSLLLTAADRRELLVSCEAGSMVESLQVVMVRSSGSICGISRVPISAEGGIGSMHIYVTI